MGETADSPQPTKLNIAGQETLTMLMQYIPRLNPASYNP